jgi:hypothetical protein
VDRQFAYQALRFGLGLEAEMRQRTRDDIVVRRALELLDGVTSPAAVFEGHEP